MEFGSFEKATTNDAVAGATTVSAAEVNEASLQIAAAWACAESPLTKKVLKAKTDPYSLLTRAASDIKDFFVGMYDEETAEKVASAIEVGELWDNNYRSKKDGKTLPFSRARFEGAVEQACRDRGVEQKWVKDNLSRLAKLVEGFAVVTTMEAIVADWKDTPASKAPKKAKGRLLRALQTWSAGAVKIAAINVVNGELNRLQRIKDKAEARKALDSTTKSAELPKDVKPVKVKTPSQVEKLARPEVTFDKIEHLLPTGPVDSRAMLGDAKHASGSELVKAVQRLPKRKEKCVDSTPTEWFPYSTGLALSLDGSVVCTVVVALGDPKTLVVSTSTGVTTFYPDEEVWFKPDWFNLYPLSKAQMSQLYLVDGSDGDLKFVPPASRLSGGVSVSQAGVRLDRKCFSLKQLRQEGSITVDYPWRFDSEVTSRAPFRPAGPVDAETIIAYARSMKWSGVQFYYLQMEEKSYTIKEWTVPGGSAPAPEDVEQRLLESSSSSSGGTSSLPDEAQKMINTDHITQIHKNKTPLGELLSSMSKSQLNGLVEYLNDANARAVSAGGAEAFYKTLLPKAFEAVTGKSWKDYWNSDGSLNKELVATQIASLAPKALKSLAKAAGALIGSCEEHVRLNPEIAAALEALVALGSTGVNPPAGTPIGMTSLDHYRSLYGAEALVNHANTQSGRADSATLNSMPASVWSETISLIAYQLPNIGSGSGVGMRGFRHNVDLMATPFTAPATGTVDNELQKLIDAVGAGDTAVLSPFLKSTDPGTNSLSPSALLNYLRPAGGTRPDFSSAVYPAMMLIKLALNLIPAPGNNVSMTQNQFLAVTGPTPLPSGITMPGNRNGGPGFNCFAFYTSLIDAAKILSGTRNPWAPDVAPDRWDAQNNDGVIVIPVRQSESANVDAFALFAMLHLGWWKDFEYAANVVNEAGVAMFGPTTCTPVVNHVVLRRPQNRILFVNVDSLQNATLPLLSINGTVVPYEGAAVDLAPAFNGVWTYERISRAWGNVVTIFGEYYGYNEFEGAMRFWMPYTRLVSPYAPIVDIEDGAAPVMYNYSQWGNLPYVTPARLGGINGYVAATSIVSQSHFSMTCHGKLPDELLDPSTSPFGPAGAIKQIGYSWGLVLRCAKLIRVGESVQPNWLRHFAAANLTANRGALFAKAFFFLCSETSGLPMYMHYPNPNNGVQRAEFGRLENEEWLHWRRLISADSTMRWNTDINQAWYLAYVNVVTFGQRLWSVTLGARFTTTERAALFGQETGFLPGSDGKRDGLGPDNEVILFNNQSLFRTLWLWDRMYKNSYGLYRYWSYLAADLIGAGNAVSPGWFPLRNVSTGAVTGNVVWANTYNQNVVFLTMPIGGRNLSGTISFRPTVSVPARFDFGNAQQRATEMEFLIPQFAISTFSSPPAVGVVTYANN